MDEKDIKLKVGDLVQWVELCNDGFVPVSSGSGVIIEKKSKGIHKVYRSNFKDIRIFNKNELVLMENGDE